MKTILKLVIATGIASIVAVGVTAQKNVQINGAGATFPNPIYSKWFDDATSSTRTCASTINPSARAPAFVN